MTANRSRRGFIAAFGLGGVAAATASAAVTQAKEETGHFKNPADYLAAMQAIGWRPVAMFQRLDDGTIRRMGVEENAPDPDHVSRTWLKFHVISMRCPVQLPPDVHDGDWWKAVWHHLYDLGLVQDVTRPRRGSLT